MIEQLVAAWCEHCRVSEDAMFRSRKPAAVKARHGCWCVLHDVHGWTFSRISRWFGTDHSTVLKAVRRSEIEVPDGD